MRLRFFHLILCCTILTASFTSCTKSVSEEFITYPNSSLNDTSWTTIATYSSTSINALFAPFQSSTIVDSFNSTYGASWKYGDSLEIVFPANSFINADATIASGTIKAEITVLKNKSDFIKYARPTIGSYSLLDAGNAINIKLTKNGKDVFCNLSNQVKIKVKAVNPNNDMKFYTGNLVILNKDTTFSWQGDFAAGKLFTWKDTLTNGTIRKLGYEYTASKLSWFGSAVAIDTALPKTRLNCTLPLNFTNKNTVLFGVFKNRNTVFNLFSDNNKKLFYALNIPVNTEMTVVSVTAINNEYFIASRTITASNANPVSLAPVKKTLNQVLDFINQF